MFRELEEEETRGYHIFSNRNRRELYRELTRAPCQNSSMLSSSTGVKPANVVWHMRKLEKEGYVNVHRLGGEVFYPAGLVAVEDVPLFYLINRKSAAQVIKALLYRCRGTDELLENISRATFYRVLRELKNLDIVETGRGTKSWVCLKDSFLQKIEEYDKRGLSFKREFIKRMEKGGYEVEVIGTYGYEVKLRILGREKFTMGIYISPLRTSLEVPG